MIEVYSDGAYNPARQRGGWAAVLVDGDTVTVLSGASDKTTSNRMEITAALEGILRTEKGAGVKVLTDSEYVFCTMTQGWKRRANLDLWESLDAAVRERNVKWEWIKGDSLNAFHKQAHNQANRQAGLEPAREGDEPGLTHIDEAGRPRMVDTSDKPDTLREAVARGRVTAKPATLELIKKGGIAKGDVLTVAQLAGIMAAKRTPDIIPLCHPLLLNQVAVELSIENGSIEITATVRSVGKTGVEMEALTAVMAAALTVYDMCKTVDRAMRITDVRLVRKSGGKSGLISLEPET